MEEISTDFANRLCSCRNINAPTTEYATSWLLNLRDRETLSKTGVLLKNF
jgi:hypothetical protein